MDAGRESGGRLPHSKTLREFRGAVSARRKGQNATWRTGHRPMFRRFLNLGGRSENSPAFGVRLSSAAFLPTLLYQLNSWLFSRLQPHRGFPPKRQIGNSHKFAYELRMQFKTMSAIGCAVACLSATAIAEDLYKFLNEIPIGGEGGWDILTIDAAARRLYLSHATKVVVVDLEKNAVVGEIEDTPGVHGFLAVPEVGRGFSSNGKENKSSVVDLKTLRTVSKIDTGESPDALVYDSKHGEVYIFNHRGNSVTVIDAKTSKVDRHNFARGRAGICRGRFRVRPRLCQHRRQKRSRRDRYRQTRSGGALAARAR